MSALKGVIAGVGVLVALPAVAQAGSKGRVSSLFGIVDQVVQRALDPKVPLIPDRRNPGSSKPLTDPSTAVENAAATAAAMGTALSGHGAVATAARQAAAGLTSTKYATPTS